jgi:hypothetical protein
MVKYLLRLSKKKGVPQYKFSTWLNRIHGTMNICRMRKDGILGCSLPCVLCRKVIEKHKIKWRAYDGEQWINSYTSDNIPKSQPTNKQRRFLKFTS